MLNSFKLQTIFSLLFRICELRITAKKMSMPRVVRRAGYGLNVLC